MSELLVITTSLNPASRSRKMARIAYDELTAMDADVDWLDLQDDDYPLVAGSATGRGEKGQRLREIITPAEGIVMAAPVYNFDVNAAAKNLIELSGKAWSNKVVGFVLSAGGKASYMSVMSLANSLMLDFRCIIIPRFAYATKEAFTDGELTDPDIEQRIREVARETYRVATALKASN